MVEELSKMMIFYYSKNKYSLKQVSQQKLSKD
jgi:hypothetical protein